MSRSEIIKRLTTNSAEIITEEELANLLSADKKLTHYIGFEISGYVHLGTGIMSSYVMKDLTDLGVQCTIWLADWHTWINEKLDGTKETAQKIGIGYFAEAIKASFKSVGGDPEKLEIRLASEWYEKNAMQYWEKMIAVSKNTSLSRMQRSIDILGRKEGEKVDFAKLIYPAMQVADIFYQELDIAHSGMDQRKAHVIMRDVAESVAPDKPKPVAIHHGLLMGIQKPQNWPVPEGTSQQQLALEMKMSKSDPDSALWVHDSEEDIERKVMKAFCPEKEIVFNPILNWTKNLLNWNRGDKPFTIERKPEHGGSTDYSNYEDLESAYGSGDVHPQDLKAMVARELIELLEPVREHFQQGEPAATKSELDKLLITK